MSFVGTPPHLHREIHPLDQAYSTKPLMSLVSRCLDYPYWTKEHSDTEVGINLNPYSEVYELNHVKSYWMLLE